MKLRYRCEYLPEQRLHKRYLSIIAVCVCVCVGAHSRIGRCVISVQFLLEYRLPPGDWCFLCLLCEWSYTHQIKWHGGRGPVWLFRSPNRRGSRRNRIRTRASYPRLCRRPVDPRWAARAPSMLPSCNGRFYPRLYGLCFCVDVCVYVSLRLLLRFLGSFLQCLPSISLYRPRQEPPPQEFQEPVGSS